MSEDLLTKVNEYSHDFFAAMVNWTLIWKSSCVNADNMNCVTCYLTETLYVWKRLIISQAATKINLFAFLAVSL